MMGQKCKLCEKDTVGKRDCERDRDRERERQRERERERERERGPRLGITTVRRFAAPLPAGPNQAPADASPEREAREGQKAALPSPSGAGKNPK